ncbi:altronate hydrolase [Dysgonomonas sp. PFB1-18]|uniref:UxaA family hydrolase n=1 Tax=unclassified Dysgonomonas TaxID=2630389 RepID=UPI002473514D|nr:MULTISPECIES: altronate dehydratase family protein [unclassified Dysgonomonas]MDH6308886.1 altronate hydrolase [Dysgonomonas sp. PF1-14]MDH6338637.1 altronate hydrolase [Dysgonomonas sp. PF1-16]MDH6380335.1 altronate hydrolase [Dysgonomonas sp. PFB1-18]MDH6397665.1 altronate hydrolase [Dysgonomonas sp. PF1-23]
MNKYLKIAPSDNVCVAIEDLKEGDKLNVEGMDIVIKNDIPTGHKFAIKEIKENEDVIKYGYPIGHATANIHTGEHVHTQNVKTNLHDDLQYSYVPVHPKLDIKKSDLKINGYLRYNGEMGIRNELWIVPTVGCVNGQAQAIINRVKNELDVSHIDDIRVYTHNYGCSQLGDDHVNTQKALAALAKHPNAGGVLVLSLGCENNQQKDFKAVMGEWDEKRVRFLISQEVQDEIETGFQMMKELVKNMRNDKREPLPLSKLKVGLKCGGSDGFSGITANPLVGQFSDWLIAQGGTSILTEVPEMFGAETILMNRAETKKVFDDTVLLINNFKHYFRRFDQPIYENPSPGNKAGGITTLEDKSLGCTQKGGNSEVVDVLDYGQPVNKHGLNLLNAPGNDLVAASALAMSGCQIVLFTTGRGTPFGAFVPTMKISTNSKLYNFKKNWIDFNAGALLEGNSMETVLNDFINFTVDVCDGKHLKHEETGFKEIAIFKTGVTL